MRIVSLTPSLTEIVCEIGLREELVGVSADSDWPPEIRNLPALTVASRTGSPRRTSDAHTRLLWVTHGLAPGQELDIDDLLELAPELVLTQARCGACSITLRPVSFPAAAGSRRPPVVSLEPTSIEGVLNAIITVGAMTETEDDAIDLVEALRARLGIIEEAVERRRDAGHPARRVVALQRLSPPATAGHWVPEQIRRAGAWDLLGEEGGSSTETSWEAIREVDPEVLLLMPSDLRLPLARTRWERTPRDAAWPQLSAVRAGQVFLLDGPAYFARPGPRLIGGIELLAELFDPDAFVDTAPPASWIPVAS